VQVRRIEIDGRSGHVAIERPRGSQTIRIDSIVRDPKGQQAWKTWEISATPGEDELYQIAEQVQTRCEGVRGTGSDIYGYIQELQRFTD
jgi:hypothetical protein